MSAYESMIGDAAGRMFEGAASAGESFDPKLWATVSESGLPRLLRPESEGGAGNAMRDASAVLQAAGWHAAAVPMADSLVAHAVLSAAGIEPGDDAPVLLDLIGPNGAPDPGTANLLETPALQGAHRLILNPWGAHVKGEWHPAGASSTQITMDDATRVQALLALSGAALLTGAMRRAFALTLEWAGTRVQFGRPIGQFQAVQHSLALAAEEIAASRAALDWAGMDLEAGRLGTAPAIAKARAAEAAGKVAAITHQVHGAIGFTAEYSLIQSTRQLWLWRERWGDEQHWQALLGRQALAGGPQQLFDLVLGEAVASHSARS